MHGRQAGVSDVYGVRDSGLLPQESRHRAGVLAETREVGQALRDQTETGETQVRPVGHADPVSVVWALSKGGSSGLPVGSRIGKPGQLGQREPCYFRGCM